MKQIEITGLEDKKLQKSILVEKENLRRLKFAHAISPLENPRKITYTRRLIARFNTEQSIRALKLKQKNAKKA